MRRIAFEKYNCKELSLGLLPPDMKKKKKDRNENKKKEQFKHAETDETPDIK